MTFGFRILTRKRAVSADVVARFRSLPVANVSDSMARSTAGGPRIRPLHQGGTILAGPALTVRTRPGDNLVVHAAFDRVEPGDVVVIDAGGDLSNAIFGELMLTYVFERKKAAGVILNGSVRDLGWIKAQTHPVFAAGVTHRGPYKDGPGEINVPIAIDGMVIEPGDLMLGDDDGFVCVPYEQVEAVYTPTKKKHEAETAQMAAILDGTQDRTWVDIALKKQGATFEG
jgi:regulator of RNase E activity RraA